MSLMKCRECNNDISDKALTCPKCGSPINNSDNNIQINNVNENKKELSVMQWLIIIFVIFILVGIAAVNSNESDTEGMVITSDGTHIVRSKDFEVIKEETYGKLLDDGTYEITGKIKQNIEESYTGIMPTFNLLDINGKKVRETSGWVLAEYEGKNIWSFSVYGNDADAIVVDFELNSCYGY